MELDLRPGEYVVWRSESWHFGNWKIELIIIIIGFLIPAGFILMFVGFVLLLATLITKVFIRSGKYLVTNMRALASYEGRRVELELNTPGLIIGLMPRNLYSSWSSESSWFTLYDVVFVVNGVEHLRFMYLSHRSAMELITRLRDMGIKVAPSYMYLL